MEFGSDLWEATQKSAQERTGNQWRALAGAVFGLLKGDRERAVAEVRVLRTVLEGRAGDLGAGGVGVLRDEVSHRERDEKRLYQAMMRVYDVMSPAFAERVTPEHFALIQECAEWYGLLPSPEASSEELPGEEKASEEAPAPPPKCEHAHVIRRFAQCAIVRKLNMGDKQGRRAAFSRLLGREVGSCAELSAQDWQEGSRALIEKRMSW